MVFVDCLLLDNDVDLSGVFLVVFVRVWLVGDFYLVLLCCCVLVIVICCGCNCFYWEIGV